MKFPDEAWEVFEELEAEMTLTQRVRFYACVFFGGLALKLYPLSVEDTVEVAKPFIMEKAMGSLMTGPFGAGAMFGQAQKQAEEKFDATPTGGCADGDCDDCDCDDRDETKEREDA